MDRIHSSHSRKELCHIIEIFNLPIANYREMNKKEISKSIMYELSKVETIPEDNETYFIKDKNELLSYLTNPDSSKTLTIKEKNKVMETAKYISMYVKNGYYLSHSPFIDWDDMYKNVVEISKYCDIPSVYKAVDKFNSDPKMKDKQPIEKIMSLKKRREMDKKHIMKQKQKCCLKINRNGPFIFDLTEDLESMRLAKAPWTIKW